MSWFGGQRKGVGNRTGKVNGDLKSQHEPWEREKIVYLHWALHCAKCIVFSFVLCFHSLYYGSSKPYHSVPQRMMIMMIADTFIGTHRVPDTILNAVYVSIHVILIKWRFHGILLYTFYG